MGYTLLRSMKVQKADGTVELRQAGEPVPEAATWANPGVWIKRGWIQADDHATSMESGYTRGKLKPMIPAGPAAIARSTSHVPVPGKPLPGVIPTGDTTSASDTAAAGDTTPDGDATSAGAGGGGGDGSTDAGSGDGTPPGGNSALPAEADTKTELTKMGREELEAFATDRGIIDPSSFANKGLLAAAILETAGK